MVAERLNTHTQSPYRKFLLKLIFLACSIIILDFAIGTSLQFFYFKQESGAQYRATYSIEKTTADILIFGSSRANHHYVPDFFEGAFRLTYYNVGRDGQFIFYHYALLKTILKRHTPKVIILDFSNNEFRQNKGAYDRLSALLPYYNSHPEIRPIVELRGRYEKIKHWSHIYPYNSQLFSIAVGNAQFNKTKKGDIKGYVPLLKTYEKNILSDTSSLSYTIDNAKVKAYTSFIHDCLKERVKIYIVCSPYLIKSDHVDYSVRLAKQIANENNVSFFDHSRDSLFLNNSSLFSDVAHLNQEGAKAFSSILISEIQQHK